MKGVVASSMAARRYWRPNLDVCETSDEVTVTLELAGVEPKDVSIQYVAKTRSLIVRGVRRSIELPDCQPSRSHQLEVYYGEFEREVRLPELDLVPQQIRTLFDNGMLIIRIPKGAGESATVTDKNG